MAATFPAPPSGNPAAPPLEAPPGARRRFAELAPAALPAAAVWLVHLATNWRYGYFGDELYFVACGDHLAWGYVDQPPLIAVIARATRWLLGDSAAALHAPAGLAHAALVFLAARLSRALGGDRFAQLLAAACVALGPGALFAGTVLTMNAFEPVFWLAGTLLLIRILEAPTLGRWLALGAVAGLGVLDKHSVLLFGFAAAVGLLFARPRLLATRGAWASAAVVATMLLPHVVWEMRHEWITVEAMRLSKELNRLPFTAGAFVRGVLMVVGPVPVIVGLVGAAHLLGRGGRGGRRWLGVAFLVAVAVVVVAEGKAYYLLPAFPPVIAAGAARLGAVAGAWRRALRTASLGLATASGALLAPFALPLLPPPALIRYQAALGLSGPRFEKADDGALPSYLANMLGWENLVSEVARAWRAIPEGERADTAILANSYGEAGAIDLLGPRLGLPKAVSGQETYALWGHRQYTGARLLAVGIPPAWLARYYDEVDVVGESYVPYAQPSENHLPIVVCRRPHPGVTLQALWPRLQRFH